MADGRLLRPFWARRFRQDWVLVLVLFAVLAALRVYGMLGPEGSEWTVMLGFLVMWFLPLVFFSRAGRRAMGVGRGRSLRWYPGGLVLGMAGFAAAGALGIALYGDGPDNWLVSVRQTYLRDPSVLQWGTTAAFLIFTVPATIFSPIGEELFFRGMAHESVRGRWGTGIATVVNSAAFGCVHLLHHGIAREGPRWMLRPGTGMLWLLLTMGLGWLFTVCRERSGSIWPAVLGHSGANLVMNLMIFFVLGGGGRSSP